MKVAFFEPPPAEKAGGLEAAIRSLEAFLKGAGVTVRCNPSLEELGAAGAPEVVHFHGLWQRGFLKVSAHCRRAGIPYVVSPHGMLEPWAWRHKWWKKWPWYLLFERRHLLGAARVLATSEGEARHLKKLLAPETCRELPLGLTSERRPDYATARRALGWTDSERILLFLSRIHPKKGLHLLLGALVGLDRESLANVRLVIVGSGEPGYVRKLRRFAETASSRLPRVDWAGEIWDERKWAYFQGADLFCLPSYTENFGLAILEALQVGTPVVTTDRTPWESVVSLGAAKVVAPEEEALRGALREILAGRRWRSEDRERLAEEIRARFSWDTVGPAYLRFYGEIVADSGRGG